MCILITDNENPTLNTWLFAQFLISSWKRECVKKKEGEKEKGLSTISHQKAEVLFYHAHSRIFREAFFIHVTNSDVINSLECRMSPYRHAPYILLAGPIGALHTLASLKVSFFIVFFLVSHEYEKIFKFFFGYWKLIFYLWILKNV